MLGLPRNVVAGLIESGFVSPTRGPRNEYRFTFQDVVLLRTAHHLKSSRIPARKMLRALQQLKEKLPEEAPLTALRIAELAAEAGLPEGVFNVVPGFGHTAGKALASSMGVDCITFTENGEKTELRSRLTVPAGNLTQDLYISSPLKTGRIMAKDEDLCLHCGLCTERCPTGAWDMQKFLLYMAHAGGSGCN